MASYDHFVLVIVTAKGCLGSGIYYSCIHRNLINHFEAIREVRIIEYEHPNVGLIKNSPPRFHPGFAKHVNWFPCFLLYRYNSWIDHVQPLYGSIYNGIYGPLGITYNSSDYSPLTADKIIEWVNRELPNIEYNDQYDIECNDQVPTDINLPLEIDGLCLENNDNNNNNDSLQNIPQNLSTEEICVDNTQQNSTKPVKQNDTNESSQTDMECIICFNGSKNCLLSPCNHLCCCSECAYKLNICPICRQPITNKTNIFIA